MEELKNRNIRRLINTVEKLSCCSSAQDKSLEAEPHLTITLPAPGSTWHWTGPAGICSPSTVILDGKLVGSGWILTAVTGKMSMPGMFTWLPDSADSMNLRMLARVTEERTIRSQRTPSSGRESGARNVVLSMYGRFRM